MLDQNKTRTEPKLSSVLSFLLCIYLDTQDITMVFSLSEMIAVLLIAGLYCCNSVNGMIAPSMPVRGGLKTMTPLVSLNGISRYLKTSPLRYRELDDDDGVTDPLMLKVKERAPLGYDMKSALKNKYTPKQPNGTPPTNGINGFLIRALTLNEYLILGIATAISMAIIFVTNGSAAFENLNPILQWSGGATDVFDFNLTGERLLWGVGAAMPLLVVSNFVDNSDQRAFANVNFSTITMCLTLFGRRSIPPDDFLPASYKDGALQKFPTTTRTAVAVQSFMLSTLTGFCEETVFRRLVPAMIVLLLGTHVNPLLPYVGQALLFGLGHAQPGNKLAENGILIGFQTFNGLGTGLLYILTGGDIVPCIISHATYDLVVFFKTWNDANDQLEYAESKYNKPLSPEIEKQVRSLIRTSNPTKDPEMSYKLMKRMFYLFDIDKNETLSLSEVRKGISYMAIERKAGNPPSQSEVDQLFALVTPPGESRLTLPDFLRMLSLFNKKVKAPSVA
jgi:membrane protease YdiL (CAAX protease family)